MADLRWYGHNGFRIRAKEGTIITDPPGKSTGYAFSSKPTADVVTISHGAAEHRNLKGIKDDFTLIDGPGEYEIHNIFVYGFRSYHDDQKGAEHGYNTIFVFEIENMRIAHLGDLGHPLTPDLTDALDNIDILMIPAGGGPGIITTEQAAKLIETIEPNLLVPMQFKTAKGDTDRAPLDELAAHLSVDLPEPVDKLSVRPTDFDDAMTFTVLNPTS